MQNPIWRLEKIGWDGSSKLGRQEWLRVLSLFSLCPIKALNRLNDTHPYWRVHWLNADLIYKCPTDILGTPMTQVWLIINHSSPGAMGTWWDKTLLSAVMVLWKYTSPRPARWQCIHTTDWLYDNLISFALSGVDQVPFTLWTLGM